MKTVLVLIFVVVMGYILVNRERLYLRDPLASVYRNGVETTGTEVFINYSNDVLLIHVEAPQTRLLVQSWNKRPGWPVVLKCIRFTACIVDSSHASLFPYTGRDKYVPDVVMSNREVSFVDPDGSKIRVNLR